MEFLRSFLRPYFARKPVVLSRNVGCFVVAFKQEKRSWVQFFRGWTHAISSTTLGLVQPTSSYKVKGASPTRAHIIFYFRVSLIYTSCRKKTHIVNHFLSNLAFMISGPHRMRKKMYRNDMFYLHYPYDPKVAKLVRQVWKLGFLKN